MIDIKTAVDIAMHTITELYEAHELKDLQLEEAAYDADSQCWEITLGHARKLAGMDAFGGNARRCFRRFTIDAVNQAVLAMSIRETLNAESGE